VLYAGCLDRGSSILPHIASDNGTVSYVQSTPLSVSTPSEVLVDQRRTVTYIPRPRNSKRCLPIDRRITCRKPKAMPTLPIVPTIKRVPPAHRVADRVTACLDLGAVVLVVYRALVDAFVEVFSLHLARARPRHSR
jgi:hypothetical protein